MDVPGWVVKVVVSVGSVVGAVLLLFFGLHFKEVYDMNKLLRETLVLQREAVVLQGETAKRVDRIVDLLPGMYQYIAREELNKPIDSFLVTTKPKEVNGNWLMYAFFANAPEDSQKVFTINLVDENDKSAAFSIAGAVQRLTAEHRSFAQMVTWSAELERPYSLQPFLDEYSSFVFHQAVSSSLDAYLTDFAGPPVTAQFFMRSNDWPTVLDYANEQVVNAVYVEQDDQP